MKILILQHLKFLKNKIKILNEIYNNTIQQSSALENKDYHILETLSEVQQKNVENFIELMGSKNYSNGTNEEIIKLEQDINHLYKKTIEMINNNQENAKNQKEEISNLLKNVLMGRNAIRNGYFKRMPQRYGYFIDKKIGKK
jgi:hypothetical protein